MPNNNTYSEGYFYGILDVYYAVMTAEDTQSAAPTYGAMAVMGKTIEATITPNYKEGKVYASNVATRNERRVDTYTVSLNLDKIPYAVREKLLGRFKDQNGVQIIKGDQIAPYVAIADEELIDQIAKDDMVRGYTISCGGFYGPQGRVLRADIADPKQNEKIEAFEYGDMNICNFEMESSAVAGLASLLGHRAMTCCMVIANRYTTEMNTEYKNSIDTLIEKVLERI